MEKSDNMSRSQASMSRLYIDDLQIFLETSFEIAGVETRRIPNLIILRRVPRR